MKVQRPKDRDIVDHPFDPGACLCPDPERHPDWRHKRCPVHRTQSAR